MLGYDANHNRPKHTNRYCMGAINKKIKRNEGRDRQVLQEKSSAAAGKKEATDKEQSITARQQQHQAEK